MHPRLTLRFEGMPERHAELAWRFGEPDELWEDAAENGEVQGLWVLASPLPAEAKLVEHLTWAADCLRPHEAFVGELINLGGRVALRLEVDPTRPVAPCEVNARLLLPLAHAGVRLDFRFGH